MVEAPGDMPPIWYGAGGETRWKEARNMNGGQPVHELGTERIPELEGRRIGKGLNSPGAAAY